MKKGDKRTLCKFAVGLSRNFGATPDRSLVNSPQSSIILPSQVCSWGASFGAWEGEVRYRLFLRVQGSNGARICNLWEVLGRNLPWQDGAIICSAVPLSERPGVVCTFLLPLLTSVVGCILQKPQGLCDIFFGQPCISIYCQLSSQIIGSRVKFTIH